MMVENQQICRWHMLDSMASLVSSVHSRKGVYAVLLGSGISRSSGILTAWEITNDLIKRIAIIYKENPDDLFAWYRENFEQEPNYSVLLEQLATTTGDRHLTLRSFVEPTREEFSEGKKAPTQGHEALAQLVAAGYIRVIVTTNFDHLMEKALDRVGITPNVISNVDQIKGRPPLVHSDCTIIKVHGDYTDTRIRNTLGELSSYEPEMNKLLNQVFEEYGLIIVGWSADWDEALRAAFERSSNSQFSTFWLAYREISSKAQAICSQRGAKIISGLAADDFFHQLKEKIELLEAGRSHSASTRDTAIDLVKKYISEDRYRTQLHDLFIAEAERVNTGLLGDKYPRRIRSHGLEELAPRIVAYDADVETLLAMMVAGGFWGMDSKLAIRCLQRIAVASEVNESDDDLRDLALYPVRLLLYGCGVAATASNRDEMVATLLSQGHTLRHGRTIGLWQRIADSSLVALFNGATSHAFSASGRSRMSICQHLYDRLLPEFDKYVSGENEFRTAFIRFEYLASLIFTDLDRRYPPYSSDVWGPHGLFVGRGFVEATTWLDQEIAREGDNLPILRTGAFSGSLQQLRELKKLFDERFRRYMEAMGIGWN